MPARRRSGRHPSRSLSILVCLLLSLTLAAPLAGEVVRVVIDRREVLLEGHLFGEAGAYEKLTGRILFVFDPEDPHNAAVVDLDLAPRNDEGKVEIWADFVVLQAVEASRRRGVAWVDLAEGGVGRSLALLNGAAVLTADPTRLEELGDGLLMEQGVTLIWVGWEAVTPSVPGGLTLPAPTAHEVDGAAVTGWVRVDWRVAEAVEQLDLTSSPQAPYPVAIPEAPVHVLTVRDAIGAPRDTIPREAWRFVLAPDGPAAGLPEGIRVDGGFAEGRIYELVYRAQDPRVTGIGFLVVRDVAAYSRYDLRSEFPTDAAVAFGVEAGARFLRQFLREGFNLDETGRGVFDAVWMHGAGAHGGGFNVRFGHAHQKSAGHLGFLEPVALFPFSMAEQADPATGRNEGLLDRLPPEATPRTVATHTDTDYWMRGAALTHSSVDGLRDLTGDSNHLVYRVGPEGDVVGRTEGDAVGRAEGDADGRAEGDAVGRAEGATVGGAEGRELRRTLRALAVGVTAWVADGDPPPDARVPTVAAGTLVPATAVARPLGGPGFDPGEAHRIYRVDYGDRLMSDGIIDREPPVAGPAFPIVVPQVDGVGNGLGGVRPVSERVPLATYTIGGTDAVPLPFDETSRVSTGDRRPTIQALYGSEAGYLARVRVAVEALVTQGFLLERDREAVILDARQWWQRLTGG